MSFGFTASRVGAAFMAAVKASGMARSLNVTLNFMVRASGRQITRQGKGQKTTAARVVSRNSRWQTAARGVIISP